MASGRRVNTISRLVCMGCEPPGGPGASFTEHLYGTLHAAAIHVGTSPDCRKLGLSVWEISIAAGTDADVMASAPARQADLWKGYPELYLYMPVNTYKTWDIPA